MLTIPHCKESLSRAYLTAVVGRARHNLLWGREFDYGVDGSVRILEQRGAKIRETGLGFDFQSKSTVDWSIEGSTIVYDLDADAYNNLTERAASNPLPFLLILLCLPTDENAWLCVSPDELVLRRCAFWSQVSGLPTTNAYTQRIRIPISNVLTPAALIHILHNIKSGVMVP